MIRHARAGLILAVCALAACDPASEAPGGPTAGEASALADAEAMLDERAPEAPPPRPAAPEPAAD